MLKNAHQPILGFAAYSGVGKTSLLKRLIPLLTEKGIRVAIIKHAHHAFDVDKPGKDSYVLREAGAGQVLLTSSRRRVLMMENPADKDPVLDNELAYLPQDEIDLILVEGFRHERFPKIELFRPSLGHQPLYVDDSDIIAIATDGDLPLPTDKPVLDINELPKLLEFVTEFIETGG